MLFSKYPSIVDFIIVPIFVLAFLLIFRITSPILTDLAKIIKGENFCHNNPKVGKFVERSNVFVCHTVFAVFSFFLFSSKGWYFPNTRILGSEVYLKDQLYEYTTSMKIFYLSQIGYHLSRTIRLIFNVLFKSHREDEGNLAMNVHHAATIFLLFGSYFYSIYYKFGVVVLFVTDFDDIFHSIAKMGFNLEVYVLFFYGVMVIQWTIFRIIVYHYFVIYPASLFLYNNFQNILQESFGFLLFTCILYFFLIVLSFLFWYWYFQIVAYAFKKDKKNK